jgi:hypothetical protein
LHALDLNGIQDLERLDVYIKDDIERYGTKLEDCHRRLKRFLTELLVVKFVYLPDRSALHFRKERMGSISLMTGVRAFLVAILQKSWERISLALGNWA